jgi:cell division protein FtsQ
MSRVNDITVTPEDRPHLSEAGSEPAQIRAPRLRAPTATKRTIVRRRLGPILSRRTRLAAGTGSALLVVALPIGLIASGMFSSTWNNLRAQAIEVSASAGLKVQEIYVSGRNRTPSDKLLGTLGIKRGDPILGFSLVEAKQRLQALAWVRDVSIERRLPGTVYLSIREREPIALWQQKGEFTLIDREGKVLPGTIDPAVNLLLVVGTDAPVNAASLIEMLKTEPELMRRVKAAQRVSGRRWNILLDAIDGGTEVRLPEENPDGAWRRLAELERDHGLLKQRLAMIDLRLNDRLVVRSEPEPAAIEPTVSEPRKKARGPNGKDA